MRIRVPPDICWEIALLSPLDVILCLLRLSRTSSSNLRPLLYRKISVGDRAIKLVHSLAENPELPPLIHSLEFRPSLCAAVHDDEWTLVLRGMVSLDTLTIAHHIPMDWQALPHISFRLRSFTSVGMVLGTWVGLLNLQPDLEELVLNADFLGKAPSLPALQHVTARVDDVAKFAQHHALKSAHLWRFSPWSKCSMTTRDLRRFQESPARLVTLRLSTAQLLVLCGSAPEMLPSVRHLAFEEDKA
ncbi:hypothetical protein C8R44DRAFT_766970 [Mycena epipterygia]|nr:hypothetical protein C8R44DRAFT_766970 [Mycena epipterygia]